MRRIQLYDTTLRDGAQGEGVNLSLEDKLMIARRLDRMGFDYIEGGYPLSNEKDVQFFENAAASPFQNAKICAFGMTRRRGVKPEDDPGMQALVDSQAPVITLVGKTSSFHVTEVLRVSLEENLAMISESVAYLRSTGREVIYDAEHFFDGWRINPRYALQTVRAAEAAGAQMVVMCDTNAGAEQVQGTINGFGERCGNADLISVIANLTLKKRGYEVLSPESLEHLTELSRYVYELANMNFRANQPFVGQSAFAHKGGMHVHAVSRATSSYEHITPEQVGNERRFLVSELSGRSNIVALTTKHNIEHDKALMGKILAEVVALENKGYQFEAAEASFDLLVKKCAGTFTPHFQRQSYHVNVEWDRHEELTTEATVKIKVGGLIHHEVGEGDGPVNALDAALRKALEQTYPNLAQMQLVDYKVRVINSEAATAANVRVVIESQDEDDVWGTVGVSENIIEASWMALVDSFEYKLYKDQVKQDAKKAHAKQDPAKANGGSKQPSGAAKRE